MLSSERIKATIVEDCGEYQLAICENGVHIVVCDGYAIISHLDENKQPAISYCMYENGELFAPTDYNLPQKVIGLIVAVQESMVEYFKNNHRK